MSTSISHAHRLLAPRIAYLIGTKDDAGTSNLIPVSNLTSVSTSPQQIALAVLKQWQTHRNLLTASGFTLSVPTIEQLDGVWKLGAKYSKFPATDPSEKLAASELLLSDTRYGPVLTTGIGWLTCRVVARFDLGGDHGITVGEITDVWFNPDCLSDDGKPRNAIRPLMQQTGNLFTTTAGQLREVQFFDADS